MEREYYLDKAKDIFAEVKKTVIGKDEIICKILMAILADGHVLLEDIPGVGKTTLANSFATALGLQCNRVQFTPDVMPSDLMGFNIYNKATGQFEFKQGAAMCNLLLADEINRTSPKTQSALLQIMEENCVSVDGNTYKLPEPFVVIATQNPFGSVGTQKLPESQLDRFMVRLTMGYPDERDEVEILKLKHGTDKEQTECVLKPGDLEGMKVCVNSVFVDDKIYKYVAKIAKVTRESSELTCGVSPRGSIALIAMAKAEAFLRGHDYVLPSDVQNVLEDVLAHRIIVKADLNSTNSQNTILSDIVKKVPVPIL